MEPLDHLHQGKPVVLEANGLQSPAPSERYTELEAAYRRALQVVLCGRYAKGDPNVAQKVARHVIMIWKEDPACNFMRLTNLAVHHYELERVRASLFGDPGKRTPEMQEAEGRH